MPEEPRGITAAQAIEHARFTTVGAGGEFPSSVDAFGLVNEAGEWMVSAHTWAWTTSIVTKVSLTAGQDYAPLPSDFGGDLAQRRTQSLTQRLHLVSLPELLEYQTNGIGFTGLSYYGAVSYVVPPGGGAPSPRLLLYPTPNVSEEDAFRLIYRHRWQYVGEASDLLTMPGYCVSLYLEALTHFIRGRVEEDQGTVARRLEGLMSSEMFKAATLADARMQSSYGPMRNTHTSPGSSTTNWAWPYNWTYVQGP